MPSRTLEDKVEELTKITTEHIQRIRNLGESFNNTSNDLGRTVAAFHDLKNDVVRLEQLIAELQRSKLDLGALADIKTDVTVLRRDVDKLERTKEEWSRRIWAMAGPIVGAAVGWALGYFSRR